MKTGNPGFDNIMYKGVPIVDPLADIVDIETTTLYLRKDGKTFDMRFKENKEFFDKMKRSKFDLFMQAIANRLGSPIFFNSPIRWGLWLNPVWRIKQWRLNSKL